MINCGLCIIMFDFLCASTMCAENSRAYIYIYVLDIYSPLSSR